MGPYDTTGKYRSGCGFAIVIAASGVIGAAVGAACFGEGVSKIATGALGLVSGEAAAVGIGYLYGIFDSNRNDGPSANENQRDKTSELEDDCT